MKDVFGCKEDFGKMTLSKRLARPARDKYGFGSRKEEGFGYVPRKTSFREMWTIPPNFFGKAKYE